MAALFLDLDNTVIYSRRHSVREPVRWVEELNGAPQSFMTEYTYFYMKRQRWLKVIPVTTRTPAQYARLDALARTMGWDTALVCNGAVLLRDGKEDLLWREESLQLSEPDRKSLQDACRLLHSLAFPASVRCAEPFLFYVKTEEGDSVCQSLLKNADLRHLSVYRDARKVYCVPNSLCKGNALSRYMEKFGAGFSIAAGDSALDDSMLNRADVCIYPETIAGLVSAAGGIACTGPVFSNELCDSLERIREALICGFLPASGGEKATEIHASTEMRQDCD